MQRAVTSLVTIVTIAVAACRSAAPDGVDAPARAVCAPYEHEWATPLEAPGLPNLHRVTSQLWRGAQPTTDGLRELDRMGMRTVLSLRAFHSEDPPAGARFACVRISFKAWHPEDEDVVRFLRIVSDPARQPVFVHCQHGADRTGMMCAIYRVAVCGWTKDEAIAEMTSGGFGFHSIWANLVDYVRDLDIENLRTRAGLATPSDALR